MNGRSLFFKLDLEAFAALRSYRRAIGLDDSAPVQLLPNQVFQEMGAWVDSLCRFDLFVTATFRPVTRRYANPRGLALVEGAALSEAPVTSMDGPVLRGLSSTDFGIRLASHSPSRGYVEGFFHKFRRRLQRDLKSPVRYFVGFEAGRLSGANHFHALLGAARLRDSSRKELFEWLFKNAVRSLVLPFEPARGAGWYLAAAYVGKRPLGWDVHVPGRTHLIPRPSGAICGGHEVVRSAELPRPFFHMTHPRWHR